MTDQSAPRVADPERVLDLPWVCSLLQSGWHEVPTTGEMLSSVTGISMNDNLITTFVRLRLVEEIACLFNKEQQQFCVIASLGTDICGHPRIVHGGFTAALVDDAFGAIVYKLKQEGVIDTAPSFTVHLEVDYHKPIPAGGMFCCTTQITSIEGRKSWAKAIVEDKPGGTKFASGKALFVTARPDSEGARVGIRGGPPVSAGAKPTATITNAAVADANGSA